jgi:hypothetical protein
MRPHFTIYLAAGLSLFFAVLSVASHIGEAITTQYAIRMLQPSGDDLARLQAACSDHYSSATESLVLAGLQGVIIVYTRKLKRQAMLPNETTLQTTSAARGS